MCFEPNKSTITIIAILIVGLWTLGMFVSELHVKEQHVTIYPPKYVYDPWNYSTTIRVDTPLYASMEESNVVFEPVLKDGIH